MRLIANGGFRYAHRAISAGEVFDAPDRDARVLITSGHAREDNEPIVAQSTAVIEELVDIASEPPREKRRYKRRDLTAE